MVKVNKGTLVSGWKVGSSAKGTYAFASVKADKGYDKITVWAYNPDDIKENETYKIKEIVVVQLTQKKVEDKWYPQYSVNAVMEKAEEKPTDGFARLDAEDIPF